MIHCSLDAVGRPGTTPLRRGPGRPRLDMVEPPHLGLGGEDKVVQDERPSQLLGTGSAVRAPALP